MASWIEAGGRGVPRRDITRGAGPKNRLLAI